MSSGNNGDDMEDSSTVVPNLNITIHEHALTVGAHQVLKVIRPQWSVDSVRFKLFTVGITNKLVGCFNVSGNEIAPGDHHDVPVTGNTDVVLIRVYGNKTDLLIDRKKETENIKLLHRYGYAPRLYATFQNGLAYEYVPGVTLTPESCCSDNVWPLVARRMAQMHKVDDPSVPNRLPTLPIKMDQFLALIPKTFSDQKKNERIWKIFPAIETLKDEFKTLYKQLSELNSPVVFCHNDLLLGNVIYDDTLMQVTFIDYEYASYNHQAFDIGNHFTEFAGIDEIDYDRYPSKEFQLLWLREYQREYVGEPTVSDGAVEQLYVAVNQYALASHFLWAIWGLIQAEHSTINFDFITFAATRYSEYCRRKNEFLSLSA